MAQDVEILAAELLQEARTFLDTHPISGIDLAAEALEYARQCTNRQLEQQALELLAELSLKAGMPAQAQQFLEQLHQLPLPDTQRANILHKLGRLLLDQQRFADAEKLLAQALPQLDISDSDTLVALWTTLGIALTKQGKIQEAAHAYRQGLKVATEETSPRRKAILYRCLGANAFSLRQYEEAFRWFQQSLQLRQQIGDRRGYAITLGNLANYYTFKGEYYRALQLLLQALDIYQELNDQVMLISAHTTLGLLFSQSRLFPQALQYFHTALQLAEKLRSLERIAKIHNNIGEVYRKQGNYRQARYHFGKALAAFTALQFTGPEKAAVLANVGLTFKAEGKLDVAERVLQLALRFFTPPTPELLTGIHIALAEIALQRGAIDRAAESIDAITPLIDDPGLWEYAAPYYRIASQIAAARHQFDKAYQQLRVAAEKEQAFQHQQQQQLFAELQFKHQLEQEQVQIATLRNQNLELLQLVEQLHTANDQLQQHSHHISNMLHLIAHDLKNPLSSIRFLLYRLQKALETGQENPQALLQQAEQLVETMQHLIAETLEQVRATPEAGLPNCTTLHLAQMIEPLVKQYMPMAKAKNVSLAVHIHDPQLTLCVIPFWVNRILDNLLSNALKYTRVGTTVTVRTFVADAQCAIAITDQGPGIAPEEQQRLFQRFTTLSAKPTGGESSSGVGLYLSQQLAALMHGRITVDSTVGVGSTFTLWLPL